MRIPHSCQGAGQGRYLGGMEGGFPCGGREWAGGTPLSPPRLHGPLFPLPPVPRDRDTPADLHQCDFTGVRADVGGDGCGPGTRALPRAGSKSLSVRHRASPAPLSGRDSPSALRIPRAKAERLGPGRGSRVCQGQQACLLNPLLRQFRAMEGVRAKYRGQCPAHTRHVLNARGQAGVPAYGEQWDFADAVFCWSRSNFLLAPLSFLLFLLTAFCSSGDCLSPACFGSDIFIYLFSRGRGRAGGRSREREREG